MASIALKKWMKKRWWRPRFKLRVIPCLRLLPSSLFRGEISFWILRLVARLSIAILLFRLCSFLVLCTSLALIGAIASSGETSLWFVLAEVSRDSRTTSLKITSSAKGLWFLTCSTAAKTSTGLSINSLKVRRSSLIFYRDQPLPKVWHLDKEEVEVEWEWIVEANFSQRHHPNSASLGWDLFLQINYRDYSLMILVQRTHRQEITIAAQETKQECLRTKTTAKLDRLTSLDSRREAAGTGSHHATALEFLQKAIMPRNSTKNREIPLLLILFRWQVLALNDERGKHTNF